MFTEKRIVVAGNGEVKLPVGFRFRPTDEELVVRYLKPKFHSLPLPASVIPEADDVFNTDPWDLSGDPREKRYFFSRRRWDANRCRGTTTGCGHWKAVGKEKYIMSKQQQAVLGIRKTLVFRHGHGRQPRESTTQWVMHEYRLLLGSETTVNSSSSQKSGGEREEWVVCGTYQRRMKPRKNKGG
ncbi:NAC domain-containing protein 83-like [Diospyros lotus]|uniref:NAC domain-containing protein 83-like n=1 Tax=Diospyros lotus TaxID=55363 RepID=UPI00224CE6E7|nr:NAC domain-containing protein 83-like [Diospyros lotus]